MFWAASIRSTIFAFTSRIPFKLSFQMNLKLITRGRVNREVQTVNWEAGKEGGCRDRCQEGPEKGTINREFKAKMEHKPWIREGLHREVQTVN